MIIFESRHLALSASGLVCDWYVDVAVFTFRAVTAAPAVGLLSTWGLRERGLALWLQKGLSEGRNTMPPRRYPWCEQKQKLLVNVLYRPDIMIFVFQNIRSLPRLLQPVRRPRRTITVRSRDYTSQQDFGTRKVYCVSNVTFHAESKYAIKIFPSPTVFVQWPF